MRGIGVVLLPLVAALLLAQPLICSAQLIDSPWPAFRHDSLHTGRSTAIGPSSGALGWKYALDGDGKSSPAVGNGAIYIAAGGNLIALAPSGSLLWSYSCGAAGASSPAIAADGTIYVASGSGNLYAVNANGTLKWMRLLAGSTEASPTIGPDGTIYIGCSNGKFQAFSSSGTPKFTFTAGGAITSSAAITSDRIIYFGCSDKYLYALNYNGTQRWKYTDPNNDMGIIQSSPAIGPDGTIYFGTMNGRFYAITPGYSGASIRGRCLVAGPVYSSPALGPDGTVYFGSRSNYFYAYNSLSNKLKWSLMVGDYTDSSPAVDGNGNVYFGCNNGSIYAVSPAGQILWSQKIGTGVSSSPALGGAGSLYAAALDGFLCSFSVDTTPPPAPNVIDDGQFSASPNSLHASWNCSDPESGIGSYEYAIGTTSGSQDILPFTNIGPNTGITSTGLSLVNGQTYYFSVRATNGAGLVGPMGVSDGVKVDYTPPAVPVVTNDGAYTANSNLLHASWASSDPESGVARYEYAIGTSPGASDTAPFTDAGPALDVKVSSLTLINGQTYYFAVRAINGAGVVSGAGVSDGIKLDSTPPPSPQVIDNARYSTSNNTLSANWTCSDVESGITRYEYAIGTSAGAQDLVPYTDAGTSTQITRADLILENGKTYYFSVRATNGAGLVGAAGSSDGIIVDYTPPAVPVVIDDGDYTDKTNTIHAVYSSGDPESGVSSYEYSVGTSAGLSNIKAWTNVGLVKEVIIDNLNLTQGSVYYVNVRVYNWAGLESRNSSNGIKVDLTPPTISSINVQGSLTQMQAAINALDPESGVSELQYVLLTSPIPPVVPEWISAPAGKEIIITGTFMPGQAYYVYGRAANALGNWSEPKLSDKVVLDTTPPTTPVVIDDGEYWSDPSTLHAAWTASDPDSGVDRYSYCVGSAPGLDDEVRWTNTSEAGVLLSGLRLTNGGRYYISVKAYNHAGLCSGVGSSDGITIDNTPPSLATVIDDGDFTLVQGSLHAAFISADDQSGISEYQYCIGTAPGADNIVAWKSSGAAADVTVNGLTLDIGVKYYFSAKARNGAGQWGAVGNSDGIAYRVADPSWPRFRCDTRGTGKYKVKACATGRMNWRVQTQGYVESSAAIAGDGTSYIGSSDGKLYAISATGAIRWSYQTGSCIDSSPAIGKNGDIYIGSYDYCLYCIQSTGSLRWKYQAGGMIWSSPAITPDGITYFGCQDNYLYALNPDGALKWKFKAGGEVWSSPVLGADGTVYFACGDGKLYAVNPDGTRKWSYLTGSAADSSPAVGDDGVIYFGSGDGNFYAINPNGTRKWSYSIGNLVDSSAAIGPDGTLYVGSGGAGLNGALHAVSPTGSRLWSLNLPGGLRSSPAIDENGTIFIGCTDGKIYAVKPGGSILWSYYTGQAILSSPAISVDGSVIIGSDDGGVYSFKDYLVNDTTPPGTPVVQVKRGFIAAGMPLTCSWSASDLESGIERYEYAVGTSPESTDIRGWTNAGTYTSATLSDIPFTPGQIYYVSVKATNNAGLTSKAGVSGGVLVVSTNLPEKIGDARRSGMGAQVYLPAKIITAVFGNYVFIEEPDRSAGIRCIAGSSNLLPGSIVDVLANVSILNDEIILTDAKIEPSGISGIIRPLLITGKALIRPPGMDPNGLMVRIAGRVAYAGMDYFILSDGSKLMSPRGMKGIEVRIDPYAMPNAGSYVAVTGVLCREIINGKSTPVIRALQNTPVSMLQLRADHY